MAEILDIKKDEDITREQVEQVCIETFEDEGFDGLVEMAHELIRALAILGETLDDIAERSERGVRAVENAVGL